MIFDLRQGLRGKVDRGLTLITAPVDLGTLASACDAGLMLADDKIGWAMGEDVLWAIAQSLQTIDRLRSDRPHSAEHGSCHRGRVSRCEASNGFKATPLPWRVAVRTDGGGNTVQSRSVCAVPGTCYQFAMTVLQFALTQHHPRKHELTASGAFRLPVSGILPQWIRAFADDRHGWIRAFADDAIAGGAA